MDIISFLKLASLIVGLYVLFAVISRTSNNRATKKVQANKESILDSAFDGSETASYKISRHGGTLNFEQVIEGANARGYDFQAENRDSKSTTTLVFKKV